MQRDTVVEIPGSVIIWRMYLILLLILLAPATAPTTASTTQPVTLAKGELVYIPPTDGWEEFKRSDDGNSIIYKFEDRAFMQINATVATAGFTKEMAKKMGNMVCQKLLKDSQANGYTLLQPPSIESDGRFILKIRHRFLQGDQESNQIQVYREVGNLLVNLAVTVRGDSAEQVKTLQEEGETLLLGAKSPRMIQNEKTKAAKAIGPPKPFSLPLARLRLTPPAEWSIDQNDAADGIVATFRDEKDPTNLIAVSVRQLPIEAKRDPKIRDLIIDEIVKGETQQFKMEGATLVGAFEVSKESKFLRKTRTKYEAKDVKFQIISRQIRSGDAVVSVTCLALEDAAERVDKIADEVATKCRPMVKAAD